MNETLKELQALLMSCNKIVLPLEIISLGVYIGNELTKLPDIKGEKVIKIISVMKNIEKIMDYSSIGKDYEKQVKFLIKKLEKFEYSEDHQLIEMISNYLIFKPEAIEAYRRYVENKGITYRRSNVISILNNEVLLYSNEELFAKYNIGTKKITLTE